MSVSVLPATSALGGGFGATYPAMQNGIARSHDEFSVAEIKEKAKVHAQKVTRGASAISLIKGARSQIKLAQNCENSGDLKGAYSAYIKALSLVQTCIDTPDFKAESQPGKRGVVWKEFQEYRQHEGSNINERVDSLETKLKEIEQSSAHLNGANGTADADADADGPVVASGGSIADRMRALQNAGMSINTSKRISHDLPSVPSTTPMSPTARSNRDSVQSLQALMSPTQRSFGATSAPPSSIQTQIVAPPVISTTSTSSQHTFVSPSTLGPPSPTSSASSSPRVSQFNLAEFTQTFPSIDELEEISALSTPPGPSGPSSANGISYPTLTSSASASAVPSPSLVARSFPIIPTDTGSTGSRRASFAAQQPLVTSFTGLSGGSSSRPESPARAHRSPSSPTVPRKPSNLSLHSASPLPGKTLPQPAITPTLAMNGTPSILPSSAAPSPSEPKPDLPVSNSITPEKLQEYLDNAGLKVLLIDIRTRSDFEREYIKHPGDALVCLEPSVLLRETVTADSIEDSLTVAPQIEWALFSNRDKFDLVVMYDDASEAFGPAFSALERAIYETAFRKMLKRMPVLLVGGIKAWKARFGEEGVVKESADTRLAREVGAHGRRKPRHKHGESRDMHAADTTFDSSPSSGLGLGLGGLEEGIRTLAFDPPSTSSSVGRHRVQTESTMGPSSTEYASPTPRADHRFSVDQTAGPSRLAMSPPEPPRLVRKPVISRPPSTQIPSKVVPDNVTSPMPQSWSSASSSIQYPSFNRTMTPTMPRSSSPSVYSSSFHPSGSPAGFVSPPPQASINPSPLSRRRSDYIDQSQEALSGSGLGARPSIDYPDLSSHHILRPPPAVAPPSLERQDNRPRIMPHSASPSLPPLGGPKPPTIPSDYPVQYWQDVSIATSGLKNMGNTCYMNATIQCLNATVPFTRFFTDNRWKSAVNMVNPLGTKGHVAHAFAGILMDMWKQETAYLTPINFRRAITSQASQFEGSEQHDCQEFLNFMLDGLHEDLNRILHKPNYQVTPAREAELERLPQPIASEQEWTIYRMRNDSLVVDFFQGQFRNRLECLTCHKTSTTYNAFMYLTLPIPTKTSRVTLYQCLDAFVKEEVMEKSDAWNCPHCKALRKATKRLSLSRLPPVLLVHLKRFSSKGQVTDKIENFVDYPVKGLDLTSYMPDSLPPGIDLGAINSQQLSMDDPRVQQPPYKYDLYAVTNHFGSLSSGHYTAFVANRGGWMYCDDSRLTPADPKDVVGKPAYVLFYKRVKA